MAGLPIWDGRFLSEKAQNGPPGFILASHPSVEVPFNILQPHTGAMKFDFAPDGFGYEGDMFLAAFGSGDPVTGDIGTPTGSRVLRVDLQTRAVQAFAYNTNLGPAGRNLSGFNRPMDAKFSPDGALYIVDFGVFETHGQVPNAVPQTGVIWGISRQ